MDYVVARTILMAPLKSEYGAWKVIVNLIVEPGENVIGSAGSIETIVKPGDRSSKH
jgi:diaminopimelate decarboxylase